MKVNDLKKIIREEVTKVVRKELVGFVKLLGESNKPKAKPKQKIKNKPVTDQSMKDMLGDFENYNFQDQLNIILPPKEEQLKRAQNNFVPELDKLNKKI